MKCEQEAAGMAGRFLFCMHNNVCVVFRKVYTLSALTEMFTN